MADLTKYISKNLHPNAKVDLTLNRWPTIGEGNVLDLKPLHLKMKGKGNIFSIEFDSSVEVIMPDLAPKGTCTIQIGGNPPTSTEYWDENGTLRTRAYNLHIYPDGRWTWVWLDTVVHNIPVKTWIGIWPQGTIMAAADMAPSVEPSPENRP